MPAAPSPTSPRGRRRALTIRSGVLALALLVALCAPAAAKYRRAGVYDPFSHLVTRDYSSPLPFVDGVPAVVLDDGRGYHNPVTIAQHGLLCWSVWSRFRRPAALRGALVAAHWLRRNLHGDGALSYPFAYAMRGTDEVLRVGWHSALAQGQAISLFTRIYRFDRDRRMLRAARRALRPLTVARSRGGLRRRHRGGDWFDEYPTAKPYLVLNGDLFTLVGLYDLSDLDRAARPLLRRGLRAARRSLPDFDTGTGTSFYADVRAYGIAPWEVNPPYRPIMPRLLTTLDDIDPHPRWRRYAAAWRDPAGP